MGAHLRVTHRRGATVEDRRDELTAMAHRLAATAESVAAVLEELAQARDSLADTSHADPEPLRHGARRARELADAERREAERLRRTDHQRAPIRREFGRQAAARRQGPPEPAEESAEPEWA